MRRRHRRPRRADRPLKVALGERSPILQNATPASRRPVLLPPVPKPAKDVLAVLLASAGLTLAARRDAQVEVLPGTPVTILISAGGQARAALVLPISECEARKLVGQTAPTRRDGQLEVLWHEDRAADYLLPDAELEQHQELAWGCSDAC